MIRELRHVRIQSYIIHLYLGTGSHWLSLKTNTFLFFAVTLVTFVLLCTMMGGREGNPSGDGGPVAKYL